MGVAVVTDSTAYLTAEQAAEHGVRVVPLQVVVGGTAYDEGVEIGPAEVATALRSWTPVSTSRPNPQAFLDAYTAAADAGADAIVSLHISAEMSGTYESAVLAARESPVPTHVVDSRSMGMGLGFLVLEAARAAEAGEAVTAIAARASRRAAGSQGFFVVATLEHLRRGGRIGSAAAILGSALAIKPVLLLDDGVIAPLEKVRTTSRAIARLEELAVTAAGERRVQVAVQHLDAADRAASLAERLETRLGDRLAPPGRVVLAEVGAVVGAHVGPGMVAVVVVPADEV
ncbi:MAG: DegV family protein [Angustibacter sp.]